MNVDNLPLKSNWSFETGLPLKVFRAITDEIETMEYEIVRKNAPTILKFDEFDASIAATKKRYTSRGVSMGIGIASFVIALVLLTAGVIDFLSLLSVTDEPIEEMSVISTFGFGNGGFLFILETVTGILLIMLGIYMFKPNYHASQQILFAEMIGITNGSTEEADNQTIEVDITIAGYLANNRGTVFKKVPDKDNLRADFDRLKKSVENILLSNTVK